MDGWMGQRGLSNIPLKGHVGTWKLTLASWRSEQKLRNLGEVSTHELGMASWHVEWMFPGERYCNALISVKLLVRVCCEFCSFLSFIFVFVFLSVHARSGGMVHTVHTLFSLVSAPESAPNRKASEKRPFVPSFWLSPSIQTV